MKLVASACDLIAAVLNTPDRVALTNRSAPPQDGGLGRPEPTGMRSTEDGKSMIRKWIA